MEHKKRRTEKKRKKKKTSISLFTLTRSLDLLCFSNFTSLCLIKHLINLLCVGGEAIGRERWVTWEEMRVDRLETYEDEE